MSYEPFAKNVSGVLTHAPRILTFAVWMCLSQLAVAATLTVGEAGGAASIQQTVAMARDGDVVLVKAGHYHEHVIVDRSITLRGEKGAIVDGDHSGHVIIVKTSRTIVEGLHIINGGAHLASNDSGVFVETQADHVTVRNNMIERCAFGIWINGAAYPRVMDNHIIGLRELITQKRGNGIQFWNVRHGLIQGNRIEYTRDGILFTISHYCKITGNRISDLRYGVHYMYADKNTVENNDVSNCTIGFAIMLSKKLIISGNRSYRNKGDGILLRDVRRSEISNNILVGNKKGIFLFESLYNRIHGNLVMGNEIGVHVWAGSEKNKVWQNDFIDNQLQVKYIGLQDEDWHGKDGGNFWSDYRGWDLNQDNIGDISYEPNSIMERLVWRYPVIKLLLNSPAVQTLRLAENQFPVIREPGIIDSAPRMKPFNTHWKEWIADARH